MHFLGHPSWLSLAWSLAGFNLFLLIHWEDEHQIFICFIYIFTSLKLKIIQIVMKVGNIKGVHKLYSVDEKIVVLHYVLHLLDSSWSGGPCFSLLSSPTAQSNKPHATTSLPATSPEIRNFRGWVSSMSHSKQNQKGAALDNWSLLFQLQHQYFHSPGSHHSPSSNLPHSPAHLTCSTYSFLIPVFLSTHPTLPLFFHSGNPSYKIPLQNND